MKKIFLTLTISLISISLFPQSNNISQFAIWKPKEGLEQKFEAGYKQHLLWHKANADKWSWFGWYVISGPRYGLFVDATFDHSWSDFDNPVSPADDRVDNNLHVFPFGEIQSVFKVSKFLELSVSDAAGENSKLIRLITISTIDFINAIEVISKLKARYTSNGLTKIFLTYKIVDGGDANQILILLGFDNFNDFGKPENPQNDLSAIQADLKKRVITEIKSETLLYREDMSLFPNK